MPVPELDLAALTAPIPGDAPSGSRVPFMIRSKMEAGRRDFEPNPDDPNAAPIPKKPDWPGIAKVALDTLQNTSKDLETAMRLMEAYTRLYHFPGMTLGLKVLKALVDDAWDYLHPMPDPEDGEGPEVRAATFNWIGDLDAGARYPHTMREVPFLLAAGKRVSMRDRLMAFDGKMEEISADEMSRAQLIEGAADEIEAAHEAFLALDMSLTEKLGNNAPGMVGLRQVLEEIRDVAHRLSSGAGDTSSSDDGSGASESSGSGDGGGSGGGGFSLNLGSGNNREEIYRQIERLASALETLEPHSPIPDLLKKAVELGRMPFRRLLRELIRDDGQLAQVYREFGIRNEDG